MTWANLQFHFNTSWHMLVCEVNRINQSSELKTPCDESQLLPSSLLMLTRDSRRELSGHDTLFLVALHMKGWVIWLWWLVPEFQFLSILVLSCMMYWQEDVVESWERQQVLTVSVGSRFQTEVWFEFKSALHITLMTPDTQLSWHVLVKALSFVLCRL